MSIRRFTKVRLRHPQRNRTSVPSIQVWAAYVLEQPDQAPVDKSIEWLLLTTVAVANLADAKKRVEWKALCCYVAKTPVAPEAPPSFPEAVQNLKIIPVRGKKSLCSPNEALWRY